MDIPEVLNVIKMEFHQNITDSISDIGKQIGQ
jgi:hypothetical protein